MRGANKVLRETRQQIAKQAMGVSAAARTCKAVRIESDHAFTQEAVAKYLPKRGRLTKDVFNGCWRAGYGARWSCARSWGKRGGDAECVRILLTKLWNHHTVT